ncbi:MAG TPA: NAD(P)H-hydrate dehydratase [Humisphaera sp.]
MSDAEPTRVTDVPKLPPRPKVGHKGTFGRVLVLAGSDAMFGAAVLSGTAALRMGSGLVQLALPKPAVPFALSITPELISLPLSDGRPDRRRLVEAAERADALVVGPGLGTSRCARARVRRMLALDKPAVLDADALNILAEGEAWPQGVRLRAVLTPHPGEMGRLAKLLGRSAVPADDDGRLEIAAAAARAFGQVVLLKGAGTVVTDGARAYVNRTGDSSLSKAGTGDVLSGVIGSLLGQGMDPFDAAALGAWLHGTAGEAAGRRLGPRAVLARDVIDALGEAARAAEG